MELQHVNVKLIVERLAEIDRESALEQLVPVFHIWIQDQVCAELLLDIADYRHVPEGPGVVLIGNEADYSVDNTDNRLGVRYNRKAALPGSNQDRLMQAARAALTACQRLEAEPRLAGKLRFGGQEIELSINDRLLAPNNSATRDAAKSDLETFSQKLFRASEYSVSYGTDPRKLFSVSVKSSQLFPTAQLLTNLSS